MRHLVTPGQVTASVLAAASLALSPFACGGHVADETGHNSGADAADVEGDDVSVVARESGAPDGTSVSRDASLDGPRFLDSPSDLGGVLTDGSDANADAADASQCHSDDTPEPVIASTTTIALHVTNTSSSDRFVLTQATECGAYSIEGEQTLVPYQCGCQCGTPPPEQLYFTRLAAGASTTLTWDGRALALYNSYVDCRPNKQYCTSITHGSLQPVAPASYVVDVVSAAAVSSGTGTNCTVVSGGDVSCTIQAQIQFGGLCNPSNIGIQSSTVSQSFMVPASGTTTVQVDI